MPSLPDTAVIILLGLLLFGPKGLAKIARQLGKLMGEFRRASNEFRSQMEEELRISEQTDRQKQIAAVEAVAPVTPSLTPVPAEEYTVDHPHLPPPASQSVADVPAFSEATPIASSGELSIMPPATGLPEARSSSLSSLIDSVPKVDPPGAAQDAVAANGAGSNSHSAPEDQRPLRYDQLSLNGTGHPVAAEESLHG